MISDCYRLFSWSSPSRSPNLNHLLIHPFLKLHRPNYSLGHLLPYLLLFFFSVRTNILSICPLPLRWTSPHPLIKILSICQSVSLSISIDPVTAPRIFPRILHDSCPQRVPLDVPPALKKIIVSLYHRTSISILPQMAHFALLPVKPDRIGQV